MPGRTLRELHGLWQARAQADEYVGTLINAWIRRGGTARGLCAGERYVDVGTVRGYREAIALLSGEDAHVPGRAAIHAEHGRTGER
jgi:hypothetical protein